MAGIQPSVAKAQGLLAVHQFNSVTRDGPLARRLAGLRRDHDLNNFDRVIAFNAVIPNAANPGKPLAVGQVCKGSIAILDHHIAHNFVKILVARNLGTKGLVAGGSRHRPQGLGLENQIGQLG